MVGVANELSDPSLQVVLDGKCVPTLKVDGSCCAFFNGKFYKRYDAKKGKTPPTGAIPCCAPDPVSGHWPHWVEVDEQAPDNKWFVAAKQTYEREGNKMEDGTYEAIGIHFQNNPYHLEKDTLHRHGSVRLDGVNDFTYEGLRNYLEKNDIEGIVFWYEGKPLCKIKRSSYGFLWNPNKR